MVMPLTQPPRDERVPSYGEAFIGQVGRDVKAIGDKAKKAFLPKPRPLPSGPKSKPTQQTPELPVPLDAELDAAIAQETANQANVSTSPGGNVREGELLPVGVDRLPPPPGGTAPIYRNTDVDQSEFGKTILSDTARGATVEGFNADMAKLGQRIETRDKDPITGKEVKSGFTIGGDATEALSTLPAPPLSNSRFATSVDNLNPESGLYQGEHDRLQQFRAGQQAQQVAQPASLPAPPGGQPRRPDYRAASGYQRDLITKEYLSAVNRVINDMQGGARGMSSKRARAAMDGLAKVYGAKLGMTPDQLAGHLSKDYGTDVQAATAANQQATQLNQAALEQAGQNRRSTQEQITEIMKQQLPKPPSYDAVALTDEDQLGNKTQRAYVYDQSTGQPVQQGGQSDPMTDARAAIAAGADKEAVNARLTAMGYPTI